MLMNCNDQSQNLLLLLPIVNQGLSVKSTIFIFKFKKKNCTRILNIMITKWLNNKCNTKLFNVSLKHFKMEEFPSKNLTL